MVFRAITYVARTIRADTMASALESKFRDEMLSIYSKSGRETRYWPKRFLQKVRRDGGLAAARHWLRPESALSLDFNVWQKKGWCIFPWKLSYRGCHGVTFSQTPRSKKIEEGLRLLR